MWRVLHNTKSAKMHLLVFVAAAESQCVAAVCCCAHAVPTCSREALLAAGLAALPCLLARQREVAGLERDSMMLCCTASAVLLADLASQGSCKVLVIW
jgi:hypothetical protein